MRKLDKKISKAIEEAGLENPKLPNKDDFVVHYFEIKDPISKEVLKEIQMTHTEFKKLSFMTKAEMKSSMTKTDDSKWKEVFDDYGNEINDYQNECSKIAEAVISKIDRQTLKRYDKVDNLTSLLLYHDVDFDQTDMETLEDELLSFVSSCEV